MAIAKTLDILLRAPTGKLDKDFKEAQQLAAKFFGGIGTLAAAAFGAVTLDNFIDQINNGIRSLDELGNRALRLNIDPTALMGLERAAIFADTSIEELEKATVSLVKNINAGASGSQKQIELFEKLGTSADLLMSMSLPEQLQAVAAGMANIENHTEKTAIAFQVFGKSGRNMLQLMADDGALLAQSMAEVQQYGGIFSAEQLSGVGAANDAWDRLLLTFNGVFRKIAADMSPALERLWLNLSDVIKPGTALNGTLMAMGDILKLAVNLMNEMVGLTSFLSQGFGTLTGRFLAGFIITVALTKAYTAMAALLSLLRVRTIALAAVEAARVAIQKKNLTASLAVAGLGVAAFVAFSDQINGLVDGLLGVADAQAKVNENVVEFANLQSGTAATKVNLSSASFGSQAALEQLLTVRTEQQGIGRLVDGQAEQTEIMRRMEEAIRQGGAIGAGGFDVEGVDL